jgi:hypothetical protein
LGRAGIAGDEIGSAIIAARLVRDLMRLCFLMEKQYAPYAKWFGKAFFKLKCAAELSPVLKKALSAETWQEREKHLVVAYEYVAGMHNALEITEPLPAKVGSFFSRPFLVIHLHGKFADAICARIEDPNSAIAPTFYRIRNGGKFYGNFMNEFKRLGADLPSENILNAAGFYSLIIR